jgi:nucleoside-diphosphate-sugar epimerase
MNQELPTLILTGASGFIGSHILNSFREDYKIYAFARRSQKEANVPYHRNVNWVQCDITNTDALNEVMNYIAESGGADYFIHLAAFYDFTFNDNPEYRRTNVTGTENILKFTRKLNVKRFIFASSLAACSFSDNKPINEESLPDAGFPYAESKKLGEELVRKYSQYFPCSVTRLAAVFGDWCEYAPLYKFLLSWLSRRIDSRILAGKGESAVPYLHIYDLCRLFRTIIDKTEELPDFDIYNASPAGSTSHRELFEIATRYYFGESVKPLHLPKSLAYPGIFMKKLMGTLHLTCDEPFEQFWMARYIDTKMNADSLYTQNTLDWNPTGRYLINRRLLFLLEKMKSHPDEWKLRNEAALKKVTRRVNLQIYEEMLRRKEKILTEIETVILHDPDKYKFEHYRLLSREDLMCYLSTLYQLLMATVRSGDRNLVLKYIDEIAIRRFAEGFVPQELCNTLSLFKKTIISELTSAKDFSSIKVNISDYFELTIQIAQDEVEDLYEDLLKKMPKEKIDKSSLLPDCQELQRKIRQLSAFYQIAPDETRNKEYLDKKII